MDGLTHKHRRFVEEYLLCASATQAAIRAGYSARSAQVTSSRLMDDPAILKAIEEAQAARSERTAVDADYLLQRLFEEIEADLADLYDETTGDLLPLHEWPPVWRRGLVAGVEIETQTADGVEVGKVKKLKLSDRVRRIEALGRHVSVNAFRENIRVEGLDTLADRLARAGRRADRDYVAARPPVPIIEHEDAAMAPSVRVPEPVTPDDGSQVPAIPTAAGDWAAPPAAAQPYAHILPPYPETQLWAETDYAIMPGSLVQRD